MRVSAVLNVLGEAIEIATEEQGAGVVADQLRQVIDELDTGGIAAVAALWTAYRLRSVEDYWLRIYVAAEIRRAILTANAMPFLLLP